MRRGGDWVWPQPTQAPTLAVPNVTAHSSLSCYWEWALGFAQRRNTYLSKAGRGLSKPFLPWSQYVNCKPLPCKQTRFKFKKSQQSVDLDVVKQLRQTSMLVSEATVDEGKAQARKWGRAWNRGQVTHARPKPKYTRGRARRVLRRPVWYTSIQINKSMSVSQHFSFVYTSPSLSPQLIWRSTRDVLFCYCVLALYVEYCSPYDILKDIDRFALTEITQSHQ